MNVSETDETNPVHKHMILGVVGTTIADRIITLQYFEYEANPIVEMMGPFMWTLFSACLIVAMCGIWYAWDMHDFLVARALVVALTVFTLLVFLGNLNVVLSA